MRDPDVKKSNRRGASRTVQNRRAVPLSCIYHGVVGRAAFKRLLFPMHFVILRIVYFLVKKVITDTVRKGIPAKECG